VFLRSGCGGFIPEANGSKPREAFKTAQRAKKIRCGGSTALHHNGPTFNGRPGTEPRWNHKDRSARPVRCNAGLSCRRTATRGKSVPRQYWERLTPRHLPHQLKIMAQVYAA
jgi:hypothetical protein